MKETSQNKCVWRPSDTIRAKVIGIAKHADCLLVCEVLNDDGQLKGWCPLGGGIEFGETGEHALKRERLKKSWAAALSSLENRLFAKIFLSITAVKDTKSSWHSKFALMIPKFIPKSVFKFMKVVEACIG